MKISNRELRIGIVNLELRIANLIMAKPLPGFERSARFAIRSSRFAILLLLLVFPVVGQTSATKAPNKVTVTLVRWPYT